MDTAAKPSDVIRWRIVNPSNPTAFREDPFESLMEAREDAWLLQWDNGQEGGEVVCTALLMEFADEMAYAASETTDLLHADWARHWANVAFERPVLAARNAAQTAASALHDEKCLFARTFLQNLCMREKGIL